MALGFGMALGQDLAQDIDCFQSALQFLRNMGFPLLVGDKFHVVGARGHSHELEVDLEGAFEKSCPQY